LPATDDKESQNQTEDRKEEPVQLVSVPEQGAYALSDVAFLAMESSFDWASFGIATDLQRLYAEVLSDTSVPFCSSKQQRVQTMNNFRWMCVLDCLHQMADMKFRQNQTQAEQKMNPRGHLDEAAHFNRHAYTQVPEHVRTARVLLVDVFVLLTTRLRELSTLTSPSPEERLLRITLMGRCGVILSLLPDGGVITHTKADNNVPLADCQILSPELERKVQNAVAGVVPSNVRRRRVMTLVAESKSLEEYVTHARAFLENTLREGCPFADGDEFFLVSDLRTGVSRLASALGLLVNSPEVEAAELAVVSNALQLLMSACQGADQSVAFAVRDTALCILQQAFSVETSVAIQWYEFEVSQLPALPSGPRKLADVPSFPALVEMARTHPSILEYVFQKACGSGQEGVISRHVVHALALSHPDHVLGISVARERRALGTGPQHESKAPVFYHDSLPAFLIAFFNETVLSSSTAAGRFSMWGQWGLSLRTIVKNLLLPQPILNGYELLVDNTLTRRALLNLLLHGAYNAHDAHVRARYTQLLNIPFVREHEYCLFAEVAADGTAASGLGSTFLHLLHLRLSRKLSTPSLSLFTYDLKTREDERVFEANAKNGYELLFRVCELTADPNKCSLGSQKKVETKDFQSRYQTSIRTALLAAASQDAMFASVIAKAYSTTGQKTQGQHILSLFYSEGLPPAVLDRVFQFFSQELMRNYLENHVKQVSLLLRVDVKQAQSVLTAFKDGGSADSHLASTLAQLVAQDQKSFSIQFVSVFRAACDSSSAQGQLIRDLVSRARLNLTQAQCIQQYGLAGFFARVVLFRLLVDHSTWFRTTCCPDAKRRTLTSEQTALSLLFSSNASRFMTFLLECYALREIATDSPASDKYRSTETLSAAVFALKLSDLAFDTKSYPACALAVNLQCRLLVTLKNNAFRSTSLASSQLLQSYDLIYDAVVADHHEKTDKDQFVYKNAGHADYNDSDYEEDDVKDDSTVEELPFWSPNHSIGYFDVTKKIPVTGSLVGWLTAGFHAKGTDSDSEQFALRRFILIKLLKTHAKVVVQELDTPRIVQLFSYAEEQRPGYAGPMLETFLDQTTQWKKRVTLATVNHEFIPPQPLALLQSLAADSKLMLTAPALSALASVPGDTGVDAVLSYARRVFQDSKLVQPRSLAECMGSVCTALALREKEIHELTTESSADEDEKVAFGAPKPSYVASRRLAVGLLALTTWSESQSSLVMQYAFQTGVSVLASFPHIFIESSHGVRFLAWSVVRPWLFQPVTETTTTTNPQMNQAIFSGFVTLSNLVKLSLSEALRVENERENSKTVEQRSAQAKIPGQDVCTRYTDMATALLRSILALRVNTSDFTATILGGVVVSSWFAVRSVLQEIGGREQQRVLPATMEQLLDQLCAGDIESKTRTLALSTGGMIDDVNQFDRFTDITALAKRHAAMMVPATSGNRSTYQKAPADFDGVGW
jgi:hypothetical protein